MNKAKKEYTEVEINITPLSTADVIRTSGAFNGAEDAIATWF